VLLGGLVQAGVAGMFTGYGGAYNLLFIGTRDSGANNSFYALNPSTGATVWRFTNMEPDDNGDGTGGIGMISGQASVSYEGDNRVYFASRRKTGGSSNTVWCLNAANGTLVWATPVGGIDGSPVLNGPP
jgi:outer membrane protein assembly factor BamB